MTGANVPCASRMEEITGWSVVTIAMDASIETIRNQMAALLPRLRRFALSLAGNGADADDLVQDTVERALRSLHQWQQGTRLDSWMFRIAQNLWIDAVRARRVRAVASHDPETAANVAVDGARDMEARLAFADTVSALGALPEDQRVVMALIVFDGMSYRDAADGLNVPIGTITSRLARARMTLAARVFGAEMQGAGS
jgi:RNA polymerase sigma factor (sigma-70 family)